MSKKVKFLAHNTDQLSDQIMSGCTGNKYNIVRINCACLAGFYERIVYLVLCF